MAGKLLPLQYKLRVLCKYHLHILNCSMHGEALLSPTLNKPKRMLDVFWIAIDELK